MARIAWLRDRTEEVYSFANDANRASIRLHANLGLEEVTRDFAFPSVTFANDGGVLYRVRLRPEGSRSR